MSLYISNRQVGHFAQLGVSYIPILLEASNCNFKHRIFSPYYKFSNIVFDSYEIINRKTKEIVYPILPTGCITFVFMFGRGAKGEIWGCNATTRHLHIPGKMSVFCVRLRPGAFRCFSCIDVNELTGRIISIENCIEETEKLCINLRYAESFHERNVMIQRFFELKHVKEFKKAKKIEECLQIIDSLKGVVKVHDLAVQMKCSPRYINRLFLNHIGLAPKVYCQILQMQLSLKLILTIRPKSLLDTAISCGYFDQAHMNRSYRKFLDCTAYDMKNVGSKDISEKELLLDTVLSPIHK